MSGWIKLHRKILDNKVWTSEPFSRGQAWVDLLLLANHDYGFFYLRDHKIEVQRGQVGWSQLRLSERWGWSRTKVRKFLKDLEKEQQVIQQQSHSTSVITIINYEQYQEKEQLEDNSKTTERQQQDTNKKNRRRIKNNKEGNLKTIFKKPTLEQVTDYCKERNNDICPQTFIDFYESKGWMIGKNKMKDWRAAVRTWEKTSDPKPKQPRKGFKNDFNI